MIAVYAANSRSISEMREILAADRGVVWLTDWQEFHELGRSASCAIMNIPWLSASPAFSQISVFRTRNPQCALALVTRWDPENARRLKGVFVDEIVWSREMRGDLANVIQQICSEEFNYVRCLAVPFREAEHLPFALRTALARACKDERPVCSVEALAQLTGCDRRTLWVQWTQSVGAESPLRLQDFIQWILLMRAVGRKRPDNTWGAVAKDLGVHPHTLGRYAKQLAGRTLPELDNFGHTELALLFRAAVLSFLLKADALDIL